MAGLLGFEPRMHGIKTRCLTAWLQPNNIQWRGADSNCRTRWERIYSPPRLATSLPLRILSFMFIIIHAFLNMLPYKSWCRPEELNPQPTDYKSVALPIELDRHK